MTPTRAQLSKLQRQSGLNIRFTWITSAPYFLHNNDSIILAFIDFAAEQGFSFQGVTPGKLWKHGERVVDPSPDDDEEQF